MSVVCVTVQMENPDKAEEWRGYILTVAKVSEHKLTHTLIFTGTDSWEYRHKQQQTFLWMSELKPAPRTDSALSSNTEATLFAISVLIISLRIINNNAIINLFDKQSQT